MSVRVTKVPLVVAHPITKPTLVKLAAPIENTLSAFCSPPENKELHFLLANDALIVQVNKLAPPHPQPWITKSSSPILFVASFLILNSAISSVVDCCTLAGLLPYCAPPVPCLRSAREKKQPRQQEKTKREKGCDWNAGAQWDALYSIHYVFICVRDVFDPSRVSPPSEHCLFLLLHSFFLGSDFSVLNGGGSWIERLHGFA